MNSLGRLIILVSLFAACKSTGRNDQATSTVKLTFDTTTRPSDEQIITSTPPLTDYSVDQNNAVTDTLAYSNSVRTRDPRLAGPLPVDTILNIMRRNRKEFSPVVENGATNQAALLGIPLPFDVGVAGRTYFRGNDQVQDYNFIALNPRDIFVQGQWRSCGQAEAVQWSDIQFHYYCQIPPIFRFCKTALLFKLKADSSGKWGNVSHREATTRLCHSGIAALSAIGKTENDLAMEYGNYKELFEVYVPMFKKLYDSQWETMSSGAKVNMLDYLLSTQTFAFDYAEQQQLLNKIYGEMKPISAGPFNPADPTDCNTYRPYRPSVDLENTNTDTNHHTRCEPEGFKLMALRAIGR